MNFIGSKYRTLLVLIGFFIASMGVATAQKVEFGLRLMPTFSSFDLKNSSGGTVDGKANFGFGASAFLGYNFNSHIGLQTEVIYSTASQKYTESDVERNIKLKYVNIPLLLSLNTGKHSLINFNIVAGPQIGISAGTDLKVSGGNGTNNQNAVLAIRKGDLGFAYGAGLDFAVSPSHNARFGVGYRGVRGLVDISKNNNNITTENYYVVDRTKIRSNAFYVGFSILF
jgi:outer membrane autotransporter protein